MSTDIINPFAIGGLTTFIIICILAIHVFRSSKRAKKRRKAEEAKRIQQQQEAQEAQRKAEEAKRQQQLREAQEAQRKAEEAKRIQQQQEAQEAQRKAEEAKQLQQRQEAQEAQRKAEEARRQQQREAQEAQRKAEEAKRIQQRQEEAQEAQRRNKAHHRQLSSEELTNIETFKSKRMYIWHFSHLYNVVEMLKQGYMYSREQALRMGLLKADAAGDLVERTHKAHPYVRFYLTIKTPTQFYNEGLGKEPGSYYYERAQRMGFPKCPLPIFLRIDLGEILNKIPERCFYSNGNLQQDRREIFQVITDPNELNVAGFNKGKVDWAEHQEAIQQEFLVRDNLSLSELKSLRIFCYNESQMSLLKSLCESFSIFGCGKMDINEVICVNKSIFENRNPMLELPSPGNPHIKVSRGKHLFELRGSSVPKIDISTDGDFSYDNGKIRIFAQEFSWRSILVPLSFEVYLLDERPEARVKEVLIYTENVRI